MKPVIIAECCQNHNGSREILRRMIHLGAENGADYLKIQSIRSKDVTYRERFEEGETDKNGIVTIIKRPYQAEFERLSRLDLTLEEERWFVEECRRAGVLPLTTVFTRSAVQEVKDMGYPAIKIASYDCASYPLLQDVRKVWNKIYISTGSTYDNEIIEAAKVLEGTDFEFLHCVTIYPTPLEELHLSRMDWLRELSGKVGYSDHSKPAETGLWASKIALALGASCIERHYTILEPQETRDGPVSIDPSMLKELREFADMSREEQMEIIEKGMPDWRKTLGNPHRALSHAELLNRDYYRGRFASRINDKVIYNWEDIEIPIDII